jgi:hypothetical protein
MMKKNEKQQDLLLVAGFSCQCFPLVLRLSLSFDEIKRCDYEYAASGDWFYSARSLAGFHFFRSARPIESPA